MTPFFPDTTLWSARGYREFLSEWFVAQKARRNHFSMTIVSRKLGMDPALWGRIQLNLQVVPLSGVGVSRCQD